MAAWIFRLSGRSYFWCTDLWWSSRLYLGPCDASVSQTESCSVIVRPASYQKLLLAVQSRGCKLGSSVLKSHHHHHPPSPLGEFVGLLCYNSIVFLTPLLLTETPGLHALLNFPHSLLCETAGCASSVTHASVHYRRTWLCTLVISGCHLKEAGGSSWGQ